VVSIAVVPAAVATKSPPDPSSTALAFVLLEFACSKDRNRQRSKFSNSERSVVTLKLGRNPRESSMTHERKRPWQKVLTRSVRWYSLSLETELFIRTMYCTIPSSRGWWPNFGRQGVCRVVTKISGFSEPTFLGRPSSLVRRWPGCLSPVNDDGPTAPPCLPPGIVHPAKSLPTRRHEHSTAQHSSERAMGFSLWNLFKVNKSCAKEGAWDRMHVHRRNDQAKLVFSVADRRVIRIARWIEVIIFSLLTGSDICPSCPSSSCFNLINMQAGLLLTNSLLILNRRRFLAKHGLDDLVNAHQQNHSPLKAQLVGMLHAVQYLKVPVIAGNVVAILFELLLGGT
jgi:immediate early response 3-interacting protein 1